MILAFIYKIITLLFDVYRDRSQRTRTSYVESEIRTKGTRNKWAKKLADWFTIQQNGRRSIHDSVIVCKQSKQHSKDFKSQKEISGKEVILLALLLFFSMYSIYYEVKGFGHHG